MGLAVREEQVSLSGNVLRSRVVDHMRYWQGVRYLCERFVPLSQSCKCAEGNIWTMMSWAAGQETA